MQESHRQRHETEPQRWGWFHEHDGYVEIEAGSTRWICSDTTMDVIQ